MDVSRRTLARYAAPAALLLGVTVAALLVRAGLGGGPAGTTTRPATSVVGVLSTPSSETVTLTRTGSTAPGPQYYTVRAGDTFSSIASREGTSVSVLEQLNPGVSSTSLQVGQRLRVK